MAPLEFDPVLLTGDDEIDAQHRELFQRVGKLLDAFRERRTREEVVGILDFLARYVVEHFGSEERVMERAAYPRIGLHRDEHRRFVSDLELLRTELATTGPTTPLIVRVNARVANWLREHIYRSDRELGAYLRDQRGGAA